MAKHGFPEAQWEAAKAEVKAALVERAKLRGTIPYSDLAKQIRSIQVEAHDQRPRSAHEGLAALAPRPLSASVEPIGKGKSNN